MTKKQIVYWYSPDEIEVFVPIVESRIPDISIEKSATLAEFIVVTKKGAMGILIYPEKSARENRLWSQLTKLTKENTSLIIFESDANCKRHEIT